MVARECEDDLSPLESKIKASSRFFGPSCKPGPWVNFITKLQFKSAISLDLSLLQVPDPLQDAVLSK